ncbi:MAG TPA: 50S ribosomal protein L11 methyltransferase [Alphaproteobacteria bacterium]|nr:50S ribosomal protein L11 methyltransferase [Alphaproteobacteria bacterium]
MVETAWTLAFEVPKEAGDLFAPLAAELTDAFTCFEAAEGSRWRFELLLAEAPDRATLNLQLALAAAVAGIPAPALVIEPLPQRDWLAENRRQFPPVEAGRFFVYGAYFTGDVSPGRIRILLDAGLAFGSGTHESTRGCLLALDRLARRRRFQRPLDLGCGSGILAIAMARLWRVTVTAADIDPVAIRVTAANARRNQVAPRVRAIISDGMKARRLRRRSGHDLIVANILARPLEKLAPRLAAALAPRGRLVLSGVLVEQAPSVIAAYRAQGLALTARIPVGSWATIILARRPIPGD